MTRLYNLLDAHMLHVVRYIQNLVLCSIYVDNLDHNCVSSLMSRDAGEGGGGGVQGYFCLTWRFMGYGATAFKSYGCKQHKLKQRKANRSDGFGSVSAT